MSKVYVFTRYGGAETNDVNPVNWKIRSGRARSKTVIEVAR